jgi:uncharacterized protein
MTSTDEPPPERAMGEEELDAWLHARAPLKPLGRTVSMVDGFVAAVVVGPVSLQPFHWIGELLAVDRAAFDTGGTPEFAAIKAVADRHNAISDGLSDSRFTPLYRTAPDGAVDAADWCEGFMAAVGLSPRRWYDVLDPAGDQHRLLMPILVHCARAGARTLAPIAEDIARTSLKKARRDIPRSVVRMREHFHLHRFGKPHPNTRPKTTAVQQR